MMERAKAIVAAVGLVVTALTAALSDDVFNVSDAGQVTFTVVTAAVSVYAVWKIPNRPASTLSNRRLPTEE